MKTTTSALTSLMLALTVSLAVCPAHAGLTDTPSEEEPPPAVEQQPPPAQEQKKPEEKPSAKDGDAKEKKAAKKRKEKDDAATAKSDEQTGDAKEADVKKAGKDDVKQKKADKKKKSDDATASEKNAETDKAADKNVEDKNAPSKDPNAPATALDGPEKTKSTVPLPKRLASFTCGAVLGYPVAFAKRAVHQTKAGNRDFIGDSTNPIAVGLATMVSLPFGFMGGVFEGAQYTIYNSWKGSGEEPFGKSTFSLSDD